MEQKPIRVAQIIGNAEAGGVEAVIMNLYRNIDHQKVVFDFFVHNTSVIINKEEIQKYGGKVIQIPSISHIFKYKKVLKNHFNDGKYDIVHSNMNSLSFVPLSVAKKCGIKVRIAHSHSTSNPREFLRHILKMVFRPFSKIYATHYFACSVQSGIWLFGSKANYEGKVHLIRNSIELNKFLYSENARNKIRTELGVSSDIKVIGHIGRFAKQKNHMFLVKIFEEIAKQKNDVQLVLLGDGHLKNKIEKYVDARQIKNVNFVGTVPNSNEYYSAMDCFLLPSLYEGFPVVGVEAQVNGLKCFFSDKITKDAKLFNETEFLSLKDPSEWALKVIDYLKLNKARSVSSFETADFDIENESKKLLDLYANFLKG